MDRTSQLMFALQSPVGLRFGATQSVTAERITFEMDIPLDKGTTCSFRMELTGLEHTVMGEVRIDRILPHRHGALPRFIAKIIDMPEPDRKVFDGWRRDQATGGISRRMERDPEAVRQQLTDQMRGSTDAESRAVLERMNTKSIYKRKTADRIEGDPFGLDHESEDSARMGLKDIRSKIRASAENLQAPPTVQPEAPPPQAVEATALPSPPSPTHASSAGDPEWLRPVRASQVKDSNQSLQWLTGVEDSPDTSEAEAPSPSPSQVAAPEPPPAEVASAPDAPEPPPAEVASAPDAPRPLVVVDGSSRPITISVAYLTQASLSADLSNGLRSSAMTVQHTALEALYLPVEIQFTLPDGTLMSCKAQTVARTTGGTALALELDSKQRKKLAAAAGA